MAPPARKLPGTKVFSLSEKSVAEVLAQSSEPSLGKKEPTKPLVVRQKIFEDWCTKANERWTQKAKQCAVHPRTEYYTDRIARRNAMDIWENETSGYDKLMTAEDFLENKHGIDREIFQREVHDRMLAICAHMIVGKEWQFIGQDIIRSRPGWQEWVQSLSLFASAFRRAGKTSAIQQFVNMLLCLLFKISVAVFSTGQRISRLFGMGVYKLICIAGYEHQIRKFTDELLVLADDEDDPIHVKILFMAPSDSEIYRQRVLFHFVDNDGFKKRSGRVLGVFGVFFGEGCTQYFFFTCCWSPRITMLLNLFRCL